MALNYDKDLLMGPVVLHVLGKLGLQGVDPIRLSKHFCQTKKSGPGTLDEGMTELSDARYKGHTGVFRGVFDMVYPSPRSLNDPLLGHSSRGYSIYPTVLDSLRVEPEGCFTFRVTEGLFIHKGVYYNSLCDETKRPRCDSIARSSTELSPLRIPKLVEPLSLSVSLREGFEEVLLTFNVQRAGLYFHVSAFDAVVGLMCLDTTPNCGHDMDDVLREEYETQVTVKSVGEASNQDYKLAITMTSRNPQAQFLACGSGTQGDLLLQCCLNCGVQQALECGYTNLIAT
ncbi:hypothetical protein E8E14_002856 [Neopestalotiopsis sp. 37M]|nr:hypothetical protein E8E14_002856 [Neopestalotiopsis sp. 37M]